ncbi:DUF3025 domain-containing protein [Usitatibacter palustris]|uniref:DUF3025 domain-containing protein n=1 Tax=Usitatibacter palustris TaxID=2732487 RepID=A0A6M4H3B6_9PROT|nr:DUF3025 domain-containing protein [Usitatibacter palustris]QJR13835.1 hypothetical protein DSM104440_00625 [Usitatibacter palustris]
MYPEGLLFAPLQPALARLPRDRWPTHDELTALAQGVVTARGQPIHFVPPRGNSDRERRYYELRIAQSGEIETRTENWHDLFNALSWITFPKAKAAINAQHAAMLEEGGDAEARQRRPERDALTLFDEGGVAVSCDDEELLRHIVDFEWKRLFWTRRSELLAKMRFTAFGHGLYEQARAPFIGLVAKTVFLSADTSVDEGLARHFAERANFRSPRIMPPMPVLGVPGWYPDTERESFYDDPVHFRGSRRRDKKIR